MMRVAISGDGGGQAARIASALVRDGFVIAAPDTPFDLLLTLGAPAQPLRAGDVAIDLVARQATRGGKRIALTPREWAILTHLARERRAVDRAELIVAVWGYAFDPGTNLVAVHIARLRPKLGPDLIRTVPGGYRLELG